VRIIAKSRLLELAQAHRDCVGQVTDWYEIARKEVWHNLVEVRASFRHADSVGAYTAFNTKGNDYRLIVEMHYDKGIIYIKHLLTHAEYDRDKWKA
jgi:mRNA interferase HigB